MRVAPSGTRSSDIAVYIVIAVALLIAISAILISTRQGIGASPDSVTYLSSARELVGNGRLTAYHGGVPTSFPVGTPFLLVVGSVAGIVNMTDAAIVINLVSTCAAILLTFKLACLCGSSKWLGAISALLLATTPALPIVSSMLWSEPAFIAVFMGFLTAATRVIRRPFAGSMQWIFVALLGGCAFLIRYIGVVALVVFLITTIVWVAERQRQGLPRDLQKPMIGLLILGTVVLSQVAWNISNDSGPLGSRTSWGAATPERLASDAAQAASSFVLYRARDNLLVGAIVLTVFFLLLASATWLLMTSKFARSALPTLSAVYLLILATAFSQLSTKIDPLNARLAIPILAPWLALVAAGLSVAVHENRGRALASESSYLGRRRRVLRQSAFLFVGVGFASFLLYEQSKFVQRASSDGIGYSNIRANPMSTLIPPDVHLSGGIASTDAARVYWHTGQAPVYPIPRRVERLSAITTDDQRARWAASLEKQIVDGDVRTIVLFNDRPPAFEIDSFLVDTVQILSVAEDAVSRSYSVQPMNLGR